MSLKTAIKGLAIAAILFLPTGVAAQNSSLNTYSPYTLYGIGTLKTLGTANLRAMGGAGTAFRDTHLTPYTATLNYLNPASYSAIPRKSFIFNFEVEGENTYLKEEDPGSGQKRKSSYNTANIRDIGILFPIAGKVGFGVSVTPYSSVGYRMQKRISDIELEGNMLSALMKYNGEGDITQVKAGIGAQLFKNFSLGAEMVYYMGYIDRTQEIILSDISGNTSSLGNTFVSMSDDVSRIFFNTGLQYNIISNSKRVLTLGATYRMGGKLNADSKTYIPASTADYYYESEAVLLNSLTSDFSMADIISVGAFYYNHKFSFGADYTFSNWGEKNKDLSVKGVMNDMKYTNTSSFKAGMQYTPNRFDIRNRFSRFTYRLGVRYDENYMTFGGKKIQDKAITFGVGVPISVGSPSNINVGFEVGQMGTLKNGLIKSNYFKFSIGLNLFGEDYWFMKQKYN